MQSQFSKVRKRVAKRRDRRDWSQYNHWQSQEVLLACHALRVLIESSTIHDWQRQNGRPRVPRRVIVLCLLVKAYFNVSYRRLHGLLVLLREPLGLDKVPHFNTVAKYGRSPGMTNTLERLLAETAHPFWLVEKVLSVDATGLILQGSGAWRANKRDDAPRDFAKIHVLSGAKTRATLAIRTTRGTRHDSTQFKPLVERVPDDAAAERITADTAYWNRDGCRVAKDAGLTPYFKPKKNARFWKWPKDDFEKMNRFAHQFPNRFAAVYHQRSTSESRNATEKLLFGDRVRSRLPVARRNEVLCREVVHNVRLLTKGPPSGGEN